MATDFKEDTLEDGSGVTEACLTICLKLDTTVAACAALLRRVQEAADCSPQAGDPSCLVNKSRFSSLP